MSVESQSNFARRFSAKLFCSSAILLLANSMRGVDTPFKRAILGGFAGIATLAPVIALAHTDSLGYIVTAGGGANLYNVEIVYGSWHNGTIAPEGDLALSRDGTLVGTETFQSLLGPVANGVLPAGLTPGVNYFWADGNDLTADGTGHSVYNFQSVTFLDITPGTYTFGYATTSGLSVNWEPSGAAIQNGTFALTAGGGVVIPGVTPDIDTAQGSYGSSGLGTAVNPAFTGGTLAIDQNGASYANNFTLDNSSTNTVDSLGNRTTLTGVFSDAAGVAGTIAFADSIGGGVVILEGQNTHTGGTTLNSGTLVQAGAGTLGGVSGTTTVNGGTLDLGGTAQTQASLIQNGGTVSNGNIAVDQYQLADGTLGADATVAASTAFNLVNGNIAGTLTGAGALAKTGSGTVILSNANTYTGGTTIGAGTLVGSSQSFGTGAIVNNGSIVLAQGADGVLANTLSGAGSMIKEGGATLTVAGDSSGFTGATFVNRGQLNVIGSLANSSVSVGSGASLSGTGTVGSTALAGGSTISPAGGGLGMLTVNGSFSQGPGAVYLAQINPITGQSDRIVVNGPATLASGAALNVSQAARALNPIGTRFTVLSASTLTGAYTLVGDTSLTAFTSLVGTYDASNAYLEVAQTRAFADASSSPNQRAAANGLQSLPASSPVFAALANLLTDAEARNAFDQLSGEVHASIQGSLLDDSRFARNAALSRLRGANCGSAQAGGVVTMNAQRACDPETLTIWGSAFGSWGDRDRDGNAASIDRSIGGFFFGADAPIGENWRVGLLSGYSRSQFDVNARRSSGESDGYHIGIYGSGQWGGFAVRAGGIFAHHDISTDRTVAFTGFSERLSAGYDASTLQGFAEVGYGFTFSAITLEPFVNLAYAHVDTDGFSEQGGSAALFGGNSSLDNTFTTLGLRASGAVQIGASTLHVRGMVGWRHAFESVPETSLNFAGGSASRVSGTPIAENAAVVESGIDFELAPNATVGVSYTGQFGDGSRDHGLRGDFKLRF